jgi:hypothetical protein
MVARGLSRSQHRPPRSYCQVVKHLAVRNGASSYENTSDHSRPAEPTRPRPRSKPPVALRIIAALFGTSALLFNAALMLSDRSPGLTRRVLGGFQRRLSERIDSDSPFRLATEGHLPESDAFVHIGVWAVAVIFIGLAVWSWRGLAVSAICLFILSSAIELGQGPFAESRSVESGDVQANAIGVSVGIAITAFAYVGWSAAATAVGIVTRRRNLHR